MKQLGFIKITYELLHSFLRLPNDVHVVGASGDFDAFAIRVRLRGTNKALPEVSEGELIPYVEAICEVGKETRLEAPGG